MKNLEEEEEEEAAVAFLFLLQIKEGKKCEATILQLLCTTYIYRSTILFLLFDNIKKSLGSKVQLLRDQQRRM